MPDPAPNVSDAPLPEQHAWEGRPTPDALQPLPNTAAVYQFETEDEQPVVLATTQQLRRIAISRLIEGEEEGPSRKADLGAVTRGVRWRRVYSPFEARWWYWRLVREREPQAYRKLIGFGPAWFVHVDPEARVPEMRVTERVWVIPGEFVGPFATHRAAQAALEQMWDLFDLCRYPEQVRRAPVGQRCAYFDMGRCDGPCDGTAPLADYRQRCVSAWAFLTGGAASWIDAAGERMQAAARELAFERAALLKEQIAFARKWAKESAPRVGDVRAMRLGLAVPVSRRKAWRVFLFDRGLLSDGPILQDRKLAQEAAAWWIAQAGASTPEAADAQIRMEQTWLVAHLLAHREGRSLITLRLDASGAVEPIRVQLAEALAAYRRTPDQDE